MARKKIVPPTPIEPPFKHEEIQSMQGVIDYLQKVRRKTEFFMARNRRQVDILSRTITNLQFALLMLGQVNDSARETAPDDHNA